MRPLTATVLGKAVATFVLGVLVGVVGTVQHRWHEPWGVVLCLVMVVTGSLTSRAWGLWPAWVTYAGGVFFAVQALSQSGPGGDVLIPAGRAIGWVWVIGSIGLALATGALPARLFRDGPATGREPEPAVGLGSGMAAPSSTAGPAGGDLPAGAGEPGR